MLRKLFILLAMTFMVLPFASQADGPAVVATHIWIREAPQGESVMTGYLTLDNLSSQKLMLVSVASPDFDSVVIQRSATPEDRDKGQPVANLTIPAHKNFVFTPAGYQLLLTKPLKRLFDGDLVTLTLTFSDHSSLTIIAPVRYDQPRN